MTIKLASLQTTPEQDNEGEWVDAPSLPGIRFRVRPLDYPPFRIGNDHLQQRLARKHGRNPVPPKELMPALGALVAKHLLLGWDGFDEPYSSDEVAEMLADFSWRRLVSEIQLASASVMDKSVEFIEDAAKNSEAPSATT